ncbi:MAG: cell division protein ZapE [Gammaproteobacteria bacterium]|nr:cell division protein ZapE [Gammaproteobacteria bacterium]
MRCGDGVIWFAFDELCGGPRRVAQHIEIALCCHPVVLANSPTMNEADNAKIRRFINRVDAFYDHNVKLITSADAPPDARHHNGKLSSPFCRTASRLKEMQSCDYLARPRSS